MKPTEFFHRLRRRWVVAAAVLLACVAGAVAYAVTTPPTYAATTTLYVSMATGTSVNDAYQGGMAAQQRVTSYSYVAGGPAVAERVIEDLGLDTTPEALQTQVSVTFPPATTLLEITVTDPTPEGAVLLADAFAAQFRALVGELETTVAGAAPAAQATVLEQAELPAAPVGRSPTEIVVLGVVLGVVLAALAALLRDRLDRRVRRSEQLGDVLAAPVITVSAHEPGSTHAYARLRRTVPGRAAPAGPVTLMVTSVSGRSLPWVGVRLARSFAAAGTRTVVVDADTSAEGPSAVLGLRTEPGLADWLGTRSVGLDTVLCHTDHGHAIVPLGVVDTRTVELLDSERFSSLLTELGRRFDHIVIAAPPSPADAAGLGVSWRCAGVVAAAELGRSRLKALREAADAFAAAGLPVLAGVALRPTTRTGRTADRERAADPATGDRGPAPQATPDPRPPTEPATETETPAQAAMLATAPIPTPRREPAPGPRRPDADAATDQGTAHPPSPVFASSRPSPTPRRGVPATPAWFVADDVMK